jgi:predicted Zn-ribbon and HTH transcriptional regulator
MTEQELRALVREAIARHLESRGEAPGPAPSTFVPVASVVQAHLSHAKFALPALGESCIIEPAVACNHCGFCKSYGH